MAIGIVDDRVLGSSVGTTFDKVEGRAVGSLVGAAVGTIADKVDGRALGNRVGDAVGILEGRSLRDSEGRSLGDSEGGRFGVIVGVMDRKTLGCSEGAEDIIGAPVGATDPVADINRSSLQETQLSSKAMFDGAESSMSTTTKAMYFQKLKVRVVMLLRRRRAIFIH